VKNTSADATTDAGTTCAQELFNAGVAAVVSGTVRPNTYEALKAAGVAIYLAPPGLSGQEVLEKFKAGILPEIQVQRF